MPSISFSIVPCFAALIALFWLVGHASADGDDNDQDTADDLVFVPPAIGAPKDRMGAGTRDASSSADADVVVLLIPQDGGLTTLSAPPLIWHLPRGHRGDLMVNLQPVGAHGSEFQLSGPFPPGRYGLDLERMGLHLELNTIYEWQVTLLNAQNGENAGRSTGVIERVPEQMNSATPAADGLWFDALSPLVDISLSGRVQVIEQDRFDQLLSTAGVSP